MLPHPWNPCLLSPPAPCTVLARLLKRRFSPLLACAPVCVDSGLKAIQLLRSGIYDLILMDIQMPYLNGVDCTRRIRAGQEGILPANRIAHIVAVTTAIGPEPELVYRTSGFDGLIGKPVRFDHLYNFLTPLAQQAELARLSSKIDPMTISSPMMSGTPEADGQNESRFFEVMPPLPPAPMEKDEPRVFYLPSTRTGRMHAISSSISSESNKMTSIPSESSFEQQLRDQTRDSLRKAGAMRISRTDSIARPLLSSPINDTLVALYPHFVHGDSSSVVPQAAAAHSDAPDHDIPDSTEMVADPSNTGSILSSDGDAIARSSTGRLRDVALPISPTGFKLSIDESIFERQIYREVEITRLNDARDGRAESPFQPPGTPAHDGGVNENIFPALHKLLVRPSGDSASDASSTLAIARPRPRPLPSFESRPNLAYRLSSPAYLQFSEAETAIPGDDDDLVANRPDSPRSKDGDRRRSDSENDDEGVRKLASVAKFWLKATRNGPSSWDERQTQSTSDVTSTLHDSSKYAGSIELFRPNDRGSISLEHMTSPVPRRPTLRHRPNSDASFVETNSTEASVLRKLTLSPGSDMSAPSLASSSDESDEVDEVHTSSSTARVTVASDEPASPSCPQQPLPAVDMSKRSSEDSSRFSQEFDRLDRRFLSDVAV